MISKQWSSHLKDPIEKKEFNEMVQEAKPVLDRLCEMLSKELYSLNNQIDGYHFLLLPGAKERLVNKLASRRKIKEIIKLIEV